MTLTDVVIPCRNESATIGPVISTFIRAPLTGNVIVVDSQCHDDTERIAWARGAYSIPCYQQGKGAAILRGMEWVQTPRVILCDGDLIGLAEWHVNALTAAYPGMIIGVPDFTRNVPWARPGKTWAMVSGERCLPSALVRSLPLSGYAAETQINNAVHEAGLPVATVPLAGVTGVARWGNQRRGDMRRDLKWLKEHM